MKICCEAACWCLERHARKGKSLERWALKGATQVSTCFCPRVRPQEGRRPPLHSMQEKTENIGAGSLPGGNAHARSLPGGPALRGAEQALGCAPRWGCAPSLQTESPDLKELTL